MTHIVNADAIARESRTERMEQRIKPTVKRTIELAAALSGTDTSDFVTTAAFQEAVRRIEEMAVTRLSEADSHRFFAALDRAEAEGPTEAMRAAMAVYEDQVENAIR